MGEELPHYLPIPLALVWITSIFIKQLSSVRVKCNNFIDRFIAFQTKEGHVCKDWSQLHYLVDMNFFIFRTVFFTKNKYRSFDPIDLGTLGSSKFLSFGQKMVLRHNS